jgi:hypothetical protein
MTGPATHLFFLALHRNALFLLSLFLLTLSKPQAVGFEALDFRVTLAETCFELDAGSLRGSKLALKGGLREGSIQCLCALLPFCGRKLWICSGSVAAKAMSTGL